MVGKRKGVQTRVLELNPRAFFVPCACHSLNLVISHAASAHRASLTLFGVPQRIYVLFSGSPKQWEVLRNKVKTSKSLTVEKLSTTRWGSRVSSVKAVRFQTKEVHEALEEVASNQENDKEHRQEADCLSQRLSNFQLIVSLVVWYDLLFQINIMSKSMQDPAIALAASCSLIKSYAAFISECEGTGYAQAILTAEEIARGMAIDDFFKPPAGRRTNLEIDPGEAFREDFFVPLIQVAKDSLQEIFRLLEAHSSLWGFLYDVGDLPNDLRDRCIRLQDALKTEEESDLDGEELCEELKHITGMLPSDKTEPRDILQFIKDKSAIDLFPNLWVALRILLTLPVSVASGERSFSKLKLIKNHLRSTMSDDRLSALSVLSIEGEVVRKSDFSDVLSDFASRKARKVLM